MRRNIASSISSTIRPERNKVYKTLLLQLGLVLAIAVFFFFFSKVNALFAVLSGGLALIAPTFLFAMLMFAFFDPGAPKRMAVLFFIGEFVKFLCSSALLALSLTQLQGSWLPTFAGFFGAMLGSWLAPLFSTRKSQTSLVQGL